VEGVTFQVTVMRGNLVAAGKCAAEKLEVNNLIHLRMKKQNTEWI
jgi:hypothetical protein